MLRSERCAGKRSLRKFEKQQKEIRRQEDMIRRFKQRGTEKLAKRAASREKRLAAMDVMDQSGCRSWKAEAQLSREFSKR